jgi:hypothetical protein
MRGTRDLTRGPIGPGPFSKRVRKDSWAAGRMPMMARRQTTFREAIRQEERSRYQISLETGIARDGNCPSKKE